MPDLTTQMAGVFAATGTNRTAEGGLDLPGFENSLEVLIGRGIRGFAVNGATGEFCLTRPDELKVLASAAARVTGGRAPFVCGIGSAGIADAKEKMRIAEGEGAAAVLLPMPYFFPYAQSDLEAFCAAVAAESKLPVLLYNLPFTTRLEADTVLRLMANCPNILGIKDSGGSLDILRALTQRKVKTLRIVGSDAVLAGALEEGLCDAVISGIAGVVPELTLAVWARKPGADAELREFIDAIRPFPVPWGLKLIGEFAGMAPAAFAQPVAPERVAQIAALREWWRAWRPVYSVQAP